MRTSSRPPMAAQLELIPAALLVLGVLLTVPTAATSESLGVSPASHDVDDAIAGETYLRYVTVQNEFDTPSTITLLASGEIADWIATDPAHEFAIPAREHQRIEVEITVPADAANGTYQGRLHFTAEPKDQPEGSGASLRYAVGVPLSLTLGGDAAPAISFAEPTARDAEAGSAPRIQVPVANEGNARALAEACALVYPADGDEPVQRLAATTEVLPGEQTTITFDADPLDLGRYRVQLAPDCGEQATAHETASATFEIVPPGSLGKEATLVSIEHEPRATMDRPVELRAILDNTGEADISQATATFRILQDGELLAVLESPTLLAPAGERTELTAYFTPEEPGRYDLEAVAVYDGRQTQQRDGFFTATADPAAAAPTAGLLAGMAPYLLTLLSVTIAAIVYWRSNRPKPPSEAPDVTEGLETAHGEPIER